MIRRGHVLDRGPERMAAPGLALEELLDRRGLRDRGHCRALTVSGSAGVRRAGATGPLKSMHHTGAGDGTEGPPGRGNTTTAPAASSLQERPLRPGRDRRPRARHPASVSPPGPLAIARTCGEPVPEPSRRRIRLSETAATSALIGILLPIYPAVRFASPKARQTAPPTPSPPLGAERAGVRWGFHGRERAEAGHDPGSDSALTRTSRRGH